MEHLLETHLTKRADVPDSEIHEPKKTWIAARLNMPHEV